jgi:hypothetical protein
MITSLPLCWPPMGFFPRQAWETSQGDCKVVLFFVRYSLALYLPINTYSPNGRSYRCLKRHFEYWSCGLVRYDTVWSGRCTSVSGQTSLHTEGKGKRRLPNCQCSQRGEVELQLYSSLNLGPGWSAPHSGRFTPRVETRCPLYRRLGVRWRYASETSPGEHSLSHNTPFLGHGVKQTVVTLLEENPMLNSRTVARK